MARNIQRGYGIGDNLLDIFPTPVIGNRAPTSSDKAYPLGQVWIYKASRDVYVLTDITSGSAHWEPISASSGAAPRTKYVVDPDETADYTTIQAAINAAQAASVTEALIYVRPGTYTENLTLYDGITIEGVIGETTITGAHTPPASGSIVIKNCNLTSATDVFSSAAAGTTTIRLVFCLINLTNGYVFDLLNWTGSLNVVHCTSASTADGHINNTGGATVLIADSIVGTGSGNSMTISGTTLISGGVVQCPLTIQGSGTSEIIGDSIFENTLTTGGSAVVEITGASFKTGSNAALSQGSTGALTLSDTSITSSANPCITGAGAGAVTLSNVNFLSNAALAATLTRGYVAESKNTKLTCGDSVYRVNAFSGDSNIISAYCDDATASGATYLKAIRGDMTVSSGDGNHSPQAVRGNIVTSSGAHSEEAYGGYYWAQQDDGSAIDSNLIGLMGAAYSLETDAADTPQQWTYGVQGILFGADTGAVFATGLQAGIASYVTYSTNLNNVGHGFLAHRNGSGAGGTAGAAYKVEAGSAIVNDWTYGLDLYNGATGLAYATADIRLWNTTTILSSATDVTMALPDETEFFVTMTDSDNFQISNVVDGTFASAIEAIEGTMTVASSASLLQGTGVMGYLEQQDGSAISSTASGVEGWLNLLETDGADAPAVYAFGVKGYLDGADASGVPGGTTAGVGSVVEYVTPFNGKAYGFAATRLDAAGGTGTAGAAAFGVLQGTVAIADWLYGLDFAAATSGFTNADIRLSNSSTISTDTEGMAVSGDVATRNYSRTNLNIPAFNVCPILQSRANTGAAPTGATGDYNIMYLQDGETMEQFILGAGQTIIAPRLEDNGLLIGLDKTTTEGAEYYWGHTNVSKFLFTVGTDASFFIEATFKVADCGTCDPLWIGFRKQGAPNAAFANYTDAAVIGLHATTNADTVITGANLNGAGWNYTNSTDAWADGESHKIRLTVSAAGVVSYLLDGVALSAEQAMTFDATDVIIPFIHSLYAAAGSPGDIHISQLAVGYTAWY